MSRQQNDPNSSVQPTPKSSASRHSPLAWDWFSRRPRQQSGSEEPSSSPQSPQVVASSSSEGYPSWLPKRPPPPAPRSTIHSTTPDMFLDSAGLPGPSAETPEPFVGGRKPTPRSVRIVSLQNSSQGEPRRDPTDPSRFSAGHPRVWSRATSAGLTTTAFSSTPNQPTAPRPRFKAPNFDPKVLRHPSWKMRLWFYLFPLFVFFHLPLQTYFDFNAVFILLTVSKFPNPAAPGVPGSGRNWALGAAAYIACWFTQVFVVFILYELVYSFIRRWRLKRPLVLPLYLSSPAFNFTAMTSYTNFCFMYYIRFSAFTPFASSSPATNRDARDHSGSLRDGLAETFYFYSQNLPTVALLVPRAALSLALLLAYSSPSSLPVGDAGIFSRRDGTFFRAEDGSLTAYARGVLIANAAWTAWRILVLLFSWIGLWAVSGHALGGICGPRYRWEEEDMMESQKTAPPLTFSDNASDHIDTPLPWQWREHTVFRVYDIWTFCLTSKSSARGEEKKEGGQGMGFDGMEKVFAAVGLGGGPPQPARRGILSHNLFDSPEPQEKADSDSEKDLEGIIPPPAAKSRDKRGSGAGPSSPLTNLPYPFVGSRSQISSKDSVPFPPSPVLEVPITDEPHTESSGEHDEEDEDEEEEEEEEGEEVEVEEEEDVESEEPSSERRTSGSMSSLGQPLTSRYPFQIRRPTRGGSVSSASHIGPHGHMSTPRSQQTTSSEIPQSHISHSTHNSRSTQSTGNRESSDSPMSSSTSPYASSFSGSAIPMPPRHPQGARRSRAGTASVSSPTSPHSPSPPVRGSASGQASRARTESMATDTSMTFGPIPLPAFDGSDDEDDHYHHDESLMDVPEAEGSQEEAEQHDSVGLLSASASPRASLVNVRHLGSGMALHRGPRSRSNTSRSHSRSRTNSATSRSESARSRAQSLIQSLAAGSRSSVNLPPRSRTDSVARFSDSPYYSTSPDPAPSSPENHTFGHPLRTQAPPAEDTEDEGELSDAAGLPLPPSRGHSGSPVSVSESQQVTAPGGEHQQSPSGFHISRAASEQPSESSVRTERFIPSGPPPGIPIPPIPIPAGRSSDSPRHHQQQYHRGVGGGVDVGGGEHAESEQDLSTAPQSFVTAPATMEGSSDSTGRTPGSQWSQMDHYTQGGAWKPA